MMFAISEDLTAYQKAQLDSMMKFADASASAVEELFDLNFKSAKAANAELMKQVRSLTGAKDVQELGSLQTAFSQANSEKLMGFVRAIYGWANDTQGEMSKIWEAEMVEVTKTISSVIDKAAKSAPPGSELAFTAVKQAMSAANQAYDAMSKAGKQVAEMTEATVAATTSGAVGKKKVA